MAHAYVVGPVDELPVGAHKVVEINGRGIGIFNVGGELFALPNLCPHQLGPLCTGKVSGTLVANRETNWQLQWAEEGEIVTCPWHGLEFRVQTGECLAYPEIRLRGYQVTVENGQIKLVL